MTLAAWDATLSSLGSVAFDTNALIYLLERREPWFPYVQRAIETVESGRVRGVISTTVEMEMLVGPLRNGDVGAYERVEMFLLHRPNLSVVEVSRAIARRAADIRARTGLSPLDSIVVATALSADCDVIIGNDAMIGSKNIGVPYLYLNDYVVRS